MRFVLLESEYYSPTNLTDDEPFRLPVDGVRTLTGIKQARGHHG